MKAVCKRICPAFTVGALLTCRHTSDAFQRHAVSTTISRSHQRTKEWRFYDKDLDRTYDVNPIRDVIDEQGAMDAFFTTRVEWLPVFRSLAGQDLPVDTHSLLSDLESALQSNVDNNPTTSLETAAIPSDPEDRKVLEEILNCMHKSLVDIPVTESKRDGPLENDNDMHFLEEGRRMLALNRFHVLRDIQGGTLEASDSLFSYCWNELQELTKTVDGNTGSIICLPHYHSLSDLHRFTDMNLIRPMQWLGKASEFEIVSLEYGSPAIRLLYKLRDMPEGPIKVERLGDGEPSEPAD